MIEAVAILAVEVVAGMRAVDSREEGQGQGQDGQIDPFGGYGWGGGGPTQDPEPAGGG